MNKSQDSASTGDSRRRRSLLYIVVVVLGLGLAGLVAWSVSARNEERRAADTVARLRNDLRSADVHKKADAARAIYNLGPLAKDAVPELVGALKIAVARMNPPAEQVPILGASYQHFVLALYAIGSPAEAALLGLLDEKEESVRLATVIGLHPRQTYVKRDQVKDAVAVNVLRKALRDNAAAVRYHACGELAEFKQVGKDALPEFLELQEKDPDEKVRSIAKIAAESIKR